MILTLVTYGEKYSKIRDTSEILKFFKNFGSKSFQNFRNIQIFYKWNVSKVLTFGINPNTGMDFGTIECYI